MFLVWLNYSISTLAIISFRVGPSHFRALPHPQQEHGFRSTENCLITFPFSSGLYPKHFTTN